jgi:hypothetical protein
MFWLSALLLSCVMRVDILPFSSSDHSTVYLELCLPSTTHRGHGVWKLNTRHLSDASFVKLVSDFWSSWRVYKSYFLSLTAWCTLDSRAFTTFQFIIYCRRLWNPGYAWWDD